MTHQDRKGRNLLVKRDHKLYRYVGRSSNITNLEGFQQEPTERLCFSHTMNGVPCWNGQR